MRRSRNATYLAAEPMHQRAALMLCPVLVDAALKQTCAQTQHKHDDAGLFDVRIMAETADDDTTLQSAL